MKIEISGLYEVHDIEKVVAVLNDAFEHYPKLAGTFPDKATRLNALYASNWYYAAYDMYYGKAYALSDEVNEVATVLHSDYMGYSPEQCAIAGSFSPQYEALMARLSLADREKRIRFYEELDRLELDVPLPHEYIYINYLGVRQSRQGEGRGGKLMDKVCAYADRLQLPIMLFTNTDHAMQFYASLGFQLIHTVRSEEFTFQSWYLLREPSCETHKAGD